MQKMNTRDLGMHVAWGDIRCSIIAEGRSWSPDVANDMVNRMHQLWDNTLNTIADTGYFDSLTEEDEEEDEYGPVPDKELIEPHVVRLMDEGDFGG